MVFLYEEYEKGAAENAARILANVTEAAKSGGVDCTSVHVADSYAAETIVDYAKDKACDLIVMASNMVVVASPSSCSGARRCACTRSSVPVLCLPGDNDRLIGHGDRPRHHLRAVADGRDWSSFTARDVMSSAQHAHIGFLSLITGRRRTSFCSIIRIASSTSSVPCSR